MILCDTNIIIELLKGNKETIKIVEKIGFNNISISSVTEMELYFGALNKSELNKIKRSLHSLDIIHIDQIISQRAVGLIEQYAKSHYLNIPDSIIAATSLVFGIDLFTYNIKDFKFIKDIRLFNLKKKE